MAAAQRLTEKQVYGIALRQAQNIAPNYGIDPVALARAATAICYIESGYNPLAKNKKSSARGIAQILSKTQKWIEDKFVQEGNYPEKIWDPEYSIMLLEYYLGWQYNRYGNDWNKAIAAYNQGSYSDKNAAGKSYAQKWNIALATQKDTSNNYASNTGTFALEFL